MKQETYQTCDWALTRRHFLRGGAGALITASCLNGLGLRAETIGAMMSEGTTAKVYVCTPCGLPCDKLEFDKPGKCPSCGMALIEKGEADKLPTVGILLFDRVEIIDYAGPWEIFGSAGYQVFTVAEKTDPINSVFGQRVVADYTFENSPRADVLLVPGGGVGNSVNNPKLIKWVQDNAKDSTYVMSVCTGAFILAKAGLLDGLTATTVRHSIDQLATAGSNIETVYDKRYVDNGKVITTAGLSSGIDGALYLVSKMLGRGVAEEVALGIEYNWDPEGRFVRAALADRYLPKFNGFKWKVLSSAGGIDHWELQTLVSEPATAPEILGTASEQIASSTPHTRGAVTLTPLAVIKREIKWKFTDEKGHDWIGTGTVKPASDEEGKLVLTLILNRKHTRVS